MQISNEIIKIFEHLCGKIGIAIDWTADNVLPYIQQLCGKFIKLELTTSVFWLVFALILSICGAVCWKIVYNHKEWGVERYRYSADDYGGRVFMYIGIGLIFIAAFAVTLTQTYDIIICNVFPEKILYDYARVYLNK